MEQKRIIGYHSYLYHSNWPLSHPMHIALQCSGTIISVYTPMIQDLITLPNQPYYCSVNICIQECIYIYVELKFIRSKIKSSK